MTPLERGPVHPDAMQNDGDLARDRDLRLFHADALGEAQAPGLQRRPALGPMKQDAGSLIEVGPEQTIAPARDLAVPIQLTRLLAARCQPEVRANLSGRTEARWIIDRMAERQGRDDADAGTLISRLVVSSAFDNRRTSLSSSVCCRQT